ncbi:hypothetical protein JXQ70_19945 [bacterium]|nr:hypothetical protein [bacterium]
MDKRNSHKRNPIIFILFLSLVTPGLVLLCFELGLRLLNIDVDAVKDKNVQIVLPLWLISDEKWIDFNKGKIQEEEGIPADTVEWLLNFEEARYYLYKMKPNMDTRIVNYFNQLERERGISFEVKSNSQGFRSREYKRKKDENVFRVVALGDSSTFGWGVDTEYMFTSVLEDRLNEVESGLDYEVLNFGMPGYSSEHGLEVFKHVVDGLEPDLVLVSFGANDCRFTHQTHRELMAREETWIGAARHFLRYFKTYKFMRKLILKIHDPLNPSRLEQRPAVMSSSTRAVPPSDFQGNLEFFLSESRQLGAQVIFMSVCSPPEYIEVVEQVAQKAQVPFINIHELLFSHYDRIKGKEIYRAMVEYYERLYGHEKMAERESLYITVDGCHPNMIGHSLIAETVLAAMIELDLIPASP